MDQFILLFIKVRSLHSFIAVFQSTVLAAEDPQNSLSLARSWRPLQQLHASIRLTNSLDCLKLRIIIHRFENIENVKQIG